MNHRRALVLIVGAFLSGILSCPVEAIQESEIPLLKERIREITNQERIKGGAQRLFTEPGLGRAASDHSQEMQQLKTMSHGSPDPKRAALRQRLNLAEVYDMHAAENVGAAPASWPLDKMVDRLFFQDDKNGKGWMHSAGHRRNILNPDFNRIGIGVSCGQGWCFLTQNFSERRVDLGVSLSRGGDEVLVSLSGNVLQRVVEIAILDGEQPDKSAQTLARQPTDSSGHFDVTVRLRAKSGKHTIYVAIAPVEPLLYKIYNSFSVDTE